MYWRIVELQVVILAGGKGRRVFPLSVDKPKPMFKVIGKPLIQHVIENLKEAGLREFIVVIGHNGEQIRDFLKNGAWLDVNIQYAFQEKELGMADALKSAEDLVEDYFFVVNADDIYESRLLEGMEKAFKESGTEAVLAYKPVEETWKYGIVDVKDGRVVRLIEKPPRGEEPTNFAVIGAYILAKKILDYYKRLPVSDHQYEDAIQAFIEDGNPVRGVFYDGFFATYKYPWDLFTLTEYLMDRKITCPSYGEDVLISERACLEGNVWLGDGTRVFEGACIRGPCYVGRNCVVGNNSLIWNYSSIGDNCVIGYSSEIKHSIIGDYCWFHSNYIGDSIISDNCSFGAGTVTANFRFDESTIKLNIDGEIVDSGRMKLGVIMADNCKTGINSCIIPGVRVGPHSIIGPNVTLDQDLEPNTIIFVDKKSYIKKENTITVTTEVKEKLREKLLKYK